MFCSVINSTSPLLPPSSLPLFKSKTSPMCELLFPFRAVYSRSDWTMRLTIWICLQFRFCQQHKGGREEGRKRGGGSTQRMQWQQMTTRQKLSKKVFHQCLRCEFISHADVLDRKPLPGDASSNCTSCSYCRYCLSGLSQWTTVGTRQSEPLLPRRVNANWEYADYFCTSSTLCTLCLSAIWF